MSNCGGMESIREECRQARGIQLFDTLRQDVRYGLRGLRRSPGFSALAISLLGIGIGATTVMFSIVNGVLLEALPYKDPQQLVLIFEQVPRAGSKFPVLAPDFLAINIGAALAMGLLALIASVIPAWRAARVDPLVALRTE